MGVDHGSTLYWGILISGDDDRVMNHLAFLRNNSEYGEEAGGPVFGLSSVMCCDTDNYLLGEEVAGFYGTIEAVDVAGFVPDVERIRAICDELDIPWREPGFWNEVWCSC